jgi:hypothetical protein
MICLIMLKKLIFLLKPSLPDDIGKVYMEWAFPEYVIEPRSRHWQLIIVTLLGACLIYAIVTGNFLFGMILVLAVLIVVYQYFQSPREISVKIGEDGIIIDEKFYPYKDIRKFWIVYNPPIKYLYLELKSGMRNLPVPLQNINPLVLRENLLKYVSEDLQKEEEEMEEIVAKLLNIE